MVTGYRSSMSEREKLAILKDNGYSIAWSKELQAWELQKDGRVVSYLVDAEATDEAILLAYSLVSQTLVKRSVVYVPIIVDFADYVERG